MINRMFLGKAGSGHASRSHQILLGVATATALVFSLAIGPTGNAAGTAPSSPPPALTEADLGASQVAALAAEPEVQSLTAPEANAASAPSDPAPAPVEPPAPTPVEKPAAPVAPPVSDPVAPPAPSEPPAAAPVEQPAAGTPETDETGDGTVPSDGAAQDEQAADTELGSAEAESLALEITPLVAGPEAVTAPYVFWTVKDASSALVGGATFQIQGPRNNGGQDSSNNSWGGNSGIFTVVDNVGQAGYVGLDLDPDPGEFQVKQLTSSGAEQNVVETARYRIRSQAAPPSFQFPNSNWSAIPSGTTDGQAPSSGAWVDQTYDFGNFAVTPLAASTKQITVRKRVLGNPLGVTSSVGTNIGNNHGYTVGTTFRLHENTGNATNPVGLATAFTCTVVTGGECTITVTGVNNAGVNYNKRYWVVEESAASGTYSNPILYVGDYNGPKSPRLLVGLTQQLTASTTPMYMPMTAAGVSGGTEITNNEIVATPKPTVAQAGSFGAVVNSRVNPTLVPKCEATKLRIGLVLDESASISPNQWTTFRNALVSGNDSVLGILKAANADVSILGFGTGTVWHHGSAAGPSALPANYSSVIPVTRPGGTSNTTNWDAALSAFEENASAYDMVLFVTDGAPNTILNGSQVSSYEVTLRSIEAPIYAANGIKDAGTRVVAIGVGNGGSGDQVAANLRAVSGTVKGSDYLQGDWEQLKKILANVVKGATCTVPIEVSKTVKNADGTTVENAGGWTFGASKTGAGSTLTGATSQTTTPGMNGVADWDLKFTQPSGQSANLTITETVQSGWSLTNVTCTLGGQTQEPSIVNGSVTLVGVTTVSESVKCTFTNTQTPPKSLVTLVKVVDNQSGGTGGVNDWTLTATGPTTGVTGVTGSQNVTAKEVTPGNYTLSESGGPGGYTPSPWTCMNGDGNVSVNTAGVVSLENGDDVTCTITNSDLPGSVTWTKVDQDDQLLAGAIWSLVGPESTDSQEVIDCVSGTCAGLLDQDPTPGAFLVEDLDWGTYTLTETTAPAGYTKSDLPVTFVISPETAGISQTLELDLPAIKNIQILGSVIWEKQNTAGDLLSGSEWLLNGPDLAELAITDCIDGPCPGPDTDPVAGMISIEGLAWGSYSLVETRAPAGYQLDTTPITFVVGPDNADPKVLLDWDLGVIENDQQTAPSLPLTGGLGTQIFLLIGGSALAIAAGMTVWRRKKGVLQTL